MLAFIYICILVLNVVTILVTYRILGNSIESKEKAIFIAVGIAIMYLLVTTAYSISTSGLDLSLSGDTGKNLITFTFVPVNALCILPILASSYRRLKDGELEKIHFRNRAIALGVVLFILLIIEIAYFKNIQTGILSMLQAS